MPLYWLCYRHNNHISVVKPWISHQRGHKIFDRFAPEVLPSPATGHVALRKLISKFQKVWLYRLPAPGGGLVSPSDFSTVMGNHLLAVAPLGRRVPISIQVLPVHLSSRIEPRLPPPVALVIATVKHSSALAGNANIAKQTDNSIVFMSLLLAKGAV